MADTKISALPNASALVGPEQIPGVQSGGNVKLTPTQIATFFEGRANSFTTAQTITPLTDAPALTIRRNSSGQTSDILLVQTEANALLASIGKTGAIAAPSLALGGATIGSNALAVTGSAAISTFLDLGSGNASATAISYGGNRGYGIYFGSGTNFSYNGNQVGNWGNGTLSIYNVGNVATLNVDAANTLAQVNGTNPNTFRVYNTSSSSNANYERGVFDWTTTANVLSIGTENAGTGAARRLQFIIGGSVLGSYGGTTANTWTFGNHLASAFDLTAGRNLIIPNSSTPASAAASGATGTIKWDASYIYVCTATDTWKRAAIATW